MLKAKWLGYCSGGICSSEHTHCMTMVDRKTVQDCCFRFSQTESINFLRKTIKKIKQRQKKDSRSRERQGEPKNSVYKCAYRVCFVLHKTAKCIRESERACACTRARTPQDIIKSFLEKEKKSNITQKCENFPSIRFNETFLFSIVLLIYIYLYFHKY